MCDAAKVQIILCFFFYFYTFTALIDSLSSERREFQLSHFVVSIFIRKLISAACGFKCHRDKSVKRTTFYPIQLDDATNVGESFQMSRIRRADVLNPMKIENPFPMHLYVET